MADGRVRRVLMTMVIKKVRQSLLPTPDSVTMMALDDPINEAASDQGQIDSKDVKTLSSDCVEESAARDANNGDNVDRVVAEALNKMSLEDRDQLFLDVHGVADIVDESKPGLVEEHLQRFDEELKKLRTQRPAVAIELAESMSPDYVNNHKIRLRFLRSTSFDVEKAAMKFMKFFDLKFELFGGEKLCKEITYDDLNSEDQEALKSGVMQVLPKRDRSGRGITAFSPSGQTFKSPESLVSCASVVFSFARFCFLTLLIVRSLFSLGPSGLFYGTLCSR